jgi:hypothetical protein
VRLTGSASVGAAWYTVYARTLAAPLVRQADWPLSVASVAAGMWTFTVTAGNRWGERAPDDCDGATVWVPADQPPPAAANGTRVGVRYALLVAGQSNAIGTNFEGIEAAGDDHVEPITADHPYSRLVMISAGTPAAHVEYVDSPDGRAPPIGQPMRGRNPASHRGPVAGSGVHWAFHCARHLLRDMHDDDEVWLINAGWGGSTLRRLDRPGFGSWQPDFVGRPLNTTSGVGGGDSHFAQAVQLFNRAVIDYALVPAALLWHQGESDCNAPFTQGGGYNPDYAAQLLGDAHSVLRRVRTDVVAAHQLPIACGTLLAAVYAADPWNAHIRAAHFQVGASDGTGLLGGRATTVDLRDLTTADQVHLTAAATRTAGLRFAQHLRHQLPSPIQWLTAPSTLTPPSAAATDS